MTSRFGFRVLLGTVALLLGQHCFAQDAERGRFLAETCLGCHGPEVEGLTNAYPTYKVPKLGGQYADYIAVALAGYKSQDRWHPTMHSQAYDLSDQDMRDLGAYFEAQGSDDASAKGTLPESASICTSCHGDTGKGINSAFPSINGQYADYLAQSLHQYKNGQRKNAVMAGFAGQLSDEDIETLAEYFASQSGLSIPES